MGVTNAMNCFMEPRSVAIIGLTRKTGPGAFNLLESMRDYGYDGTVYPVNPNATEILGLRAYKGVKDIQQPVDLAVIYTPRQHVLPALEESAEAGIRAAIVIPQGFADADARGKIMQDEMGRFAAERGIRILGPNTLGVVNAYSGFTSSFMPIKREKVPVGVICQSGVFFYGSSLFSWRMGKAIDIGNGCDIDFAEALEYFGRDRDIKVILLHVEGTKNGKALFDTARKVARKKPVIVLKTAKSDSGAKAAATHSGAMIGDHAVFEAALRQCGAFVAGDGDEALDLTKSFLLMPPMKGKSMGVITFTGAGAIMFVDALESRGLQLAKLSSSTVKPVKDLSPEWMPIANPLDIWPAVMKHGMEKVYTTALEATLKDRNVHGVFCIAVAPPLPEMAFADASGLIHDVASRFPKKPVAAWLYGPNQHERSEDLEARGRVVSFPTVERAGRALKALWDHRQFSREKCETVSRYRVQSGRAKKRVLRSLKNNAPFTDRDLWFVLEAYGIPAVHSEFARNRKEVFAAASAVGYPVVLKVSSPDVNHKSDAGGVTLNIRNQAALGRACREMRTNLKRVFPRADLNGFLVQKMVEGGREIILGAKRDPQFGPVVMFGLGGIHTEVLQDTVCAIAPLTKADAGRMLEQIKAAAIIEGIRGERGLDKDFLVESILRVSQLMTDIPEIQELDLNPVKVFEKGGVAVDARIFLGR
jgi:acyl-CoA synthetase (NDP forming)